MEIKEIPIDKIKILENSRIRIDDEELSSLMEDIKQRGLLEPIGVVQLKGEYFLEFGNRRLEAFKKLQKTTIPAIIKQSNKIDFGKFLANNYAENAERVNLNPIELARLCNWFRSNKYSIAEIAILLSEPKTKIRAALIVDNATPEEFKDNISYGKGNKRKTGKLSPTLTNKIISPKSMKKENIPKLLNYAKEYDLSGRDVDLINALIREYGLTFDEAIKKRLKYKMITISIPIRRDIAEGYLKTMSGNEFIMKCIERKIPEYNDLLLK